MIHISVYDEDYNPYDESEIDEEDRCPICGGKLITGYEEDDAYGSSIRVKIRYCKKCD